MKHTYNITGMTCGSCVSKVRDLISKVDGIDAVKIDQESGDAKITMSKHISTKVLQASLKDHPRYQLNEKVYEKPVYAGLDLEEEKKSWLETYKPILLVGVFITGATLLIQYSNGVFNTMQWMNHFMAAFFIVFSFFKFLNLTGFAESYSMYDVIAKRWKAYGYLYPFIELLLGVAYLIAFAPVITNSITLIVMGVSIVGVIQSVLENKKIKCACLGDVFNLPMSTITIIEDALMILMSAYMLVIMFFQA
jgi:copper chaperone CopZ